MTEVSMFLVLCSPGHVQLAVKDALDTLHAEWRAAAAHDPELEARARGCRAVIYVPEPRLLETKSRAGSRDPMRAVVRAAHVAGVRHLVIVQSSSCSFLDEARSLEDGRVDYTIVRSAPLLDELADATNLHVTRSVWLPSGPEVVVATRPALATTVRHALTRDDLRRGVVAVPEECLPRGEAMRRAAAIAGAGVRVHVTARSLSSAIGKLYAWLGVARPEVDVIWEELGGPTSHAFS